jgi:hypothetical protein
MRLACSADKPAGPEKPGSQPGFLFATIKRAHYRRATVIDGIVGSAAFWAACFNELSWEIFVIFCSSFELPDSILSLFDFRMFSAAGCSCQ